MVFTLFRVLIAAHILAGTIGAVSLWVPVIGRKGGARHKLWGKVFTIAVITTGCIAILLSLLTLKEPLAMHPHLVGRFDEAFVAGIFGWMMLHNGILTINLGVYGWLCVRNRAAPLRNRHPFNLALQALVMVAALVCAAQGWRVGQPLMMAISVVGMATGLTNLYFIYHRNPGPLDWMKEHLKALVGAGISVYTAFFAFGSARIFPALALNPLMWAIPLSVGLSIIIYHRVRIGRKSGAQTEFGLPRNA